MSPHPISGHDTHEMKSTSTEPLVHHKVSLQSDKRITSEICKVHASHSKLFTRDEVETKWRRTCSYGSRKKTKKNTRKNPRNKLRYKLYNVYDNKINGYKVNCTEPDEEVPSHLHGKNIFVWKRSKQGSCIFEDCFCPVPGTPYL